MSIQQARGAVATVLNSLGTDKKMYVVAASVIEGTQVTRIFGRLDKRAGNTLPAAEASAVIARSLGDKVVPVADSFVVLASDAVSDLVTGLVCPKRISRPFSPEEGMRVMAGNMYMDNEQHLWKLHKTEAGDILVRSEVDNVDEVRAIMASLCSSVTTHFAIQNEKEVQQYNDSLAAVAGGQDILFVDPENFTVTAGTVMAVIDDVPNSVAVAGAFGSCAISRDLIVCATNFEGLEDAEAQEQEANASSFDIAQITDYYSKLFQRRPEYFDQFMARWRAHFSVA